MIAPVQSGCVHAVMRPPQLLVTLTSANRLTSHNSKTDLQSYLTQDTARAQMPTLAARSDKGISFCWATAFQILTLEPENPYK
jgi:hypothetical protein